MAGIRIGRGTRTGIGLGPMISARHQERLGELVADATARGARVVCAGGVVPGDGHFFAPVVLCDVPDDARVMREEIFGPIAPIAVFDDDDEVIDRANDVRPGTCRVCVHPDLERAMRMGALLEAGMIGINRGRVSCASAPFGGVKHSGYGHSGGPEGLDEYLVTRCMTMPDPTAPANVRRPCRRDDPGCLRCRRRRRRVNRGCTPRRSTAPRSIRAPTAPALLPTTLGIGWP